VEGVDLGGGFLGVEDARDGVGEAEVVCAGGEEGGGGGGGGGDGGFVWEGLGGGLEGGVGLWEEYRLRRPRARSAGWRRRLLGH
jgi:hypothetical protein